MSANWREGEREIPGEISNGLL